MPQFSEQNIGHTFFRCEEILSTNDMLRNLSATGVVGHGAVVTAQYQTGGRGQEQTQWESKPRENLLFSVLLQPENCTAETQVFLNMTICLSIYDVVNTEFPGRVRIKWPNDMYVDQRKIAGILIENVLAGLLLKQSIVGIGLNINQETFETENAISMKMLDGRERKTEDVLGVFLNKLNSRYDAFLKRDFSSIEEDFHEHLYKRNEQATFILKGEKVVASVVGTDLAGRLVLEMDGERKYFHNKEIEWII